jgi:dGTPase
LTREVFSRDINDDLDLVRASMAKTTTGEDYKYRQTVQDRVQAAIRAGRVQLTDVLRECEGADPVLVASILESIFGDQRSPCLVTATPPQESLSTFSRQLPAPDPFRSQWWFSSAGISHLLSIIDNRAGLFDSPRMFCLGVPTLAPYLCTRNCALDILDIDEQVLAALQPLASNAVTHKHDASDDLPEELIGSFQIAILDPPWYQEAIYTFLNQAVSALAAGGEILCTLPGRLTRPGIETFCAELISDVVKAGHEILAVERGTVQYQVPRFELVTLERLSGFRGLPWRAGDLLHVRKSSESKLPKKKLAKIETQSFSRNPAEFRMFVRDTAQADGVSLKELPKYSQNISTRAYPDEDADIWSTEKIGIQIGNATEILSVLGTWSEGLGRKESVTKIITGGCSPDHAEEIVERLDSIFQLWSKFATNPPLRLDSELEEARKASLSHYATSPSNREHGEKSDSFRRAYQRDRDRILWSTGLRRLSNKTQLFPVEHDDDLRQRLTHSIEVSQLASTIGTSFGFDGELIEAGALAHDIGHTPFGHAGEHALNKLLCSISPELGGFNHYEHGVDVVRYLEGPYYTSPAIQFTGLNITPEVCECIFKHTYRHSGMGFSSV